MEFSELWSNRTCFYIFWELKQEVRPSKKEEMLLRENSPGVVVNVLDWDIAASKFEIQSRNNVHFQNHTLKKGMDYHNTQAMG